MPQYQGIWTLAQAAQLQSTQRWATDPLFENTTLLLQADNAANGAQNNTFLDSSSNNFTITRNGNTTQGTFSPYSLQPGAWGNFFTGTSSLAVPAGSAFAYGTGAFTIEVWINPSTYQAGTFAGGQIFTQTASGQNYLTLGIGGTGGVGFTFGSGGGTGIGTLFNAAPIGQWTHVACVREGTGSNQFKIYINGVLAQTGTCSFDFTNTSYNPTVANYTHEFTQLPFGGYISNLRVVKGVAVYTGNFSPPTSPLTATQSAGTNIAAITGTQTSLLTCQSFRFVDNSVANSGAGWTVTTGGSPSVQAFSPFAPQYQYTPSVTGGSGYFDGSGDKLTAAANAAFQFGTGDFAIEFWFYPTSLSNYQTPIDMGYNGAGSYVIQTGNGDGTPVFYSAGSVLLLSSTAWRLNAFNHVVVCRSGTTLSMFINGARTATATNSTNFNSNSTLGIGAAATASPDYPAVGYLSGVRLVKGSSVYSPSSTTIIIPTAPPTAIPNTVLLCNFTNAGIYDGTMKNNLETVGNAQVSTSVVKYGTGSMYFDGSGDYLTLSPSQSLNAGTGDFTVEMWVYPTSYSAATNYPLWDQRGTSVTSTGYYFGLTQTNGYPMVYLYPSIILTGSSGPALNTWSHIAFSRSNGTIRAFVNGVQVGSVSNSISVTDPGAYSTRISQSTVGATENYTGYIDDLRITKGIARYTANFIPPSVALPRQ